MRTYPREDVVFQYNGDFSGHVNIIDRATGVEVKVLGSELIALVASYVRGERIARLEQMSDLEVLGISEPKS